MAKSAPTDPVGRLTDRLEEAAQDTRERLGNLSLPRPLRSRGRRLLAEVFRHVQASPAESARKGRVAWVKGARALLKRFTDLDEWLAPYERPPQPFYAKGRLGMLRLMEPLRVRFVFDRLRLERAEEEQPLAKGLVRRVDWFWERIRRARPDLFEETPEREPVRIFRDLYELVWGKVAKKVEPPRRRFY